MEGSIREQGTCQRQSIVAMLSHVCTCARSVEVYVMSIRYFSLLIDGEHDIRCMSSETTCYIACEAINLSVNKKICTSLQQLDHICERLDSYAAGCTVAPSIVGWGCMAA